MKTLFRFQSDTKDLDNCEYKMIDFSYFWPQDKKAYRDGKFYRVLDSYIKINTEDDINDIIQVVLMIEENNG